MCVGVMQKTGEEIIITGSFDGRVGVWDMRSKMNERPHLVSIFPNEPSPSIGGGIGSVGTSSKAPGKTAAGKVVSSLTEILAVQFDSNNNTIVTGGNDAEIKVYDANTYDLLGKHVGHTEASECLFHSF